MILRYDHARLVDLVWGRPHMRAALAALVPAPNDEMHVWLRQAGELVDQAAVVLATGAGERLVGWAGASGGLLGVVVDPAHRRARVGTELVLRLFEAGHPPPGRARDAAGRAFFARLGVRPFGARVDPLDPPPCGSADLGPACEAPATHAWRTGTLERLSARDYFCAHHAERLRPHAPFFPYWGHPALVTLAEDTLG